MRNIIFNAYFLGNEHQSTEARRFQLIDDLAFPKHSSVYVRIL